MERLAVRQWLFPLLIALILLILIVGAYLAKSPRSGAEPGPAGTAETSPSSGGLVSATEIVSEFTPPIPTPTGLQGDGGLPPSPEATGTSVAVAPPDPNAVLAQVSKDLPEGRMVFNPPAEMRQGAEERVELRVLPLAPGASEKDVQATLEAGLQGSGTPQVESLKVATIMKARLEGEGFRITPLSEEAQFVSNDTFTQWAWDITALRSGRQKLNLQITVQVNVDPVGQAVREWPVKTETVLVRVDPLYSVKTFVGTYWQWLATTLLIPISVGLYRFYTARKKAAEAPKGGKKGRRTTDRGRQ